CKPRCYHTQRSRIDCAIMSLPLRVFLVSATIFSGERAIRLLNVFGCQTCPRPQKSAAELAELIMAEIRKHSECDAVHHVEIAGSTTGHHHCEIRRSRVSSSALQNLGSNGVPTPRPL